MVRFIIVGNEFDDRSHIAHNSGIFSKQNKIFLIFFTIDYILIHEFTKGAVSI